MCASSPNAIPSIRPRVWRRLEPIGIEKYYEWNRRKSIKSSKKQREKTKYMKLWQTTALFVFLTRCVNVSLPPPRFQSSNIPMDPVITITISVGCICYCCYESSVSVVRFAKFTRVKWLGTRIWHYDPWTNWFQNFSNCLHSVGFICVCASLSLSLCGRVRDFPATAA